MNILLTGPPGIGKTTIVKKVLSRLDRPAFGFFTEEVREHNRRIGFDIVTLSGRRGILARIDQRSSIHVGRYSVLLRDLEKIAIPELIRGLNEINSLIVIDEIGKMELFSELFVDTIMNCLDTGRVFGTIAQKIHGVGMQIKERKDVKIYVVSHSNRDRLPQVLLDDLSYSSGEFTSR